MMKSLRLNSDGDLGLDENGNWEMVKGKEEVRQRIKIKMRTNWNEWFLDLSLGVNWHEILDKLDRKRERIELELIRILNQDDAIQEAQSVDSEVEVEGRRLYVKYKALLRNGEEIQDEVEVI